MFIVMVITHTLLHPQGYYYARIKFPVVKHTHKNNFTFLKYIMGT